METTKLYYTSPPDDQFQELKEKAIEIWSGHDNTFGYVDEKVGAIKDIQNVKDNFMYIVSMFDLFNQKKLANNLSDDTRESIRERMIDGGTPEHFIVF